MDNQLVRAFFGTTKYCNHFLNHFKCFNSEKCMFLHYIADKNDIIAESSKFGYSEHIKLSKKIIGFSSIQSQLYVMNHEFNSKSVLPNILTIYHKDDILIKTKNHRRKRSNGSDSSSNNLNIGDSHNNTRSSSNSSNRNYSNEKKEGSNNKLLININNINKVNDEGNNYLFKPRNESRFDFANNNINNSKIDLEYNNNSDLISISQNLLNELSLRFSYFIQFDKNIPLNKVEYDFCNEIFKKSKNDELRKIIENCF